MQTVYNILILYICCNTMVGVFAEAFGIDVGLPIVDALEEFVTGQESTVNELEDEGGFQTDLIFGDWVTVGEMFINFFSGGYIIGMVELLSFGGLNFPAVFVLGLTALFATAIVWGIMYLVSGRGTKSSD